jgi:hypothetical protein
MITVSASLHSHATAPAHLSDAKSYKFLYTIAEIRNPGKLASGKAAPFTRVTD